MTPAPACSHAAAAAQAAPRPQAPAEIVQVEQPAAPERRAVTAVEPQAKKDEPVVAKPQARVPLHATKRTKPEPSEPKVIRGVDREAAAAKESLAAGH